LDAAETSIKKTVIHLCSLVLLVYNNGFPQLLFKLFYLCSQRKGKQLAFVERNWFYVLRGTVQSQAFVCVCR